MNNPIEVWNLPNGIRVISQQIKNSLIVQTGIVANVGTRDEELNQNGIAHLFEHMAFKGTNKRKSWHILNSIDSVGGEINAFTTREKTSFHTTTTKQHLNRALDLLTDIVFYSNFPEKELEKEKLVIYDEMDMYADNPEESIFDQFENLMFPNQTLGLPILGNRETLSTITVSDLKNFRDSLYTNPNVVISIVGNFKRNLLENYCKNYIEPISMPDYKRPKRTAYKGDHFENNVLKTINQGHLIMGGTACNYFSEDFYAFSLLIHYLGGETMNNLLNLNIREKYGICYHINSFYVPYEDTGIWGIYAGFDFDNLKKLEKLIFKELNQLIENSVSPSKLQRIKKQFIGHLILSNESRFNRMQSQAKNLLDYGRILPLEEIIASIEQITIHQFHEVAKKYCNPYQLNKLIYQPQK